MQPGDTIEIGEVAMAYSLRPSAVLNALLAPRERRVRPSRREPHASSVRAAAAPARQSAPYGARASTTAQLRRTTAAVRRSRAAVGAANRGRARISVRQGPGQGAVAELADVTVIGNHPQQATLVLADPRLGPRHVEILRQADGFYARDLGTQIGTSCRGQRLGPQPFKLAQR